MARAIATHIAFRRPSHSLSCDPIAVEANIMLDFILLSVGLISFLLLAGYAAGCERV
ncbi:MAG: hypothetical protein JWP04_748 [Belnapia sp.]|nr:hypothetical protein [Belnapia sp.]